MHVDAGPSIVCKGKMGKVTCFITSLYKLSKRVVTDIDGSFGKWAEMTSSTKRQSKFSIYIDLHRDVQVAPPKNLLETNHFKLDEKFIHRRLELEQQETPQMAGSSTHLEPSQKMLFLWLTIDRFSLYCPCYVEAEGLRQNKTFACWSHALPPPTSATWVDGRMHRSSLRVVVIAKIASGYTSYKGLISITANLVYILIFTKH